MRNQRPLDGIERFFKIDKKKHSGNVCKIGICDSIVNEAGIFCDGPAFQKPPGDLSIKAGSTVLSPDAAAFDAIL